VSTLTTCLRYGVTTATSLVVMPVPSALLAASSLSMSSATFSASTGLKKEGESTSCVCADETP